MSWAEWRDRTLPMIPPAILLLIAAVQSYNVRYHDLTRWKGGGFGMFSTVDEPGRRIVRCYLVGEDGREVPLKLPPNLQRLVWEARSIPTPDRVSRLARELADGLNQQFAKSGALVPARYVRAKIWRAAFDSESGQLTATKIAEATVER